MKHGWVKLTKEQEAWLKQAHFTYAATHPREKPAGPPLYKRRMVSHDGIAVFGNGILAKFSLGKSGRYRFVPFTQISGIYPVRIDNPFTKADSRWLGLSSWKGLQIESEGSLTYLVNSRRHDFETLVPVLKRAMGARWERVYRPDEMLWTNFIEGQALVPAALRGPRAPSTPTPPLAALGLPMATPGPFVAIPTVMPSGEGRGSLLLEESPEDVRERGTTYRKAGVLFLGIGAASLAIGFALQSLDVRTGSLFLTYVLWLPFLLALLLILLGGVFLLGSRQPRPIRIYEHGFEFPALVGGHTLFFSYGEVMGVRERRTFFEGETYVFTTQRPGQVLALRKTMRGLPPVLESIRPKFGRPEQLIRLVPTKEESVASRKIEYALYGVAVLAGVIVSTATAAVLFAGSSLDVVLTGLGLILPPFTILTITFMTFQLRNREKVVPARLNVKVPSLVVVILLAVFLATIATGYGTPEPPSVVTETIEPKPASSALGPGSYENMTLNLTGSLLVDAGQTIAIRNSIVTMKLSTPKSVGVWVARGGTLVLDNVTLASDPSSNLYTFEVMGSASILASSISGVWGDRQRVNLDGGIELYSSNVIVDRTRITGAVTNGILISNAAPTVANSTIEGAGDDAIEMHNSSARITGNTIDSCGWAMVIEDGSSPLVQGNLFHANRHGIAIDSSDPVIELNRFDANSNYAIRYDETSHPVLRGNVYTLNEKNVVSEDSIALLEICGLSTVGLAIFSLLLLFWIYKEGLRKEQLRREFGTVPPYRP